jgi:hypothetical protein
MANINKLRAFPHFGFSFPAARAGNGSMPPSPAWSPRISDHLGMLETRQHAHKETRISYELKSIED